jgi:hypothetical protein
MSLIKLPPGMTPAQFWASPQGQQAAAHQKRFQDELAQRQGWEPHDFLPDHSRPPAPPAPRPAGGRRPVSQRPQFTPPPPPQYQGPEMGGVWQNGVKIGDAPWGPPAFHVDPATGQRLPRPLPMPPPAPPGQAQPKVDPAAAATRPRDAARNEIAAALKEMFPELDPGKIQVLSAQLAAEYQRERTAAVDSLRPEAPMAEPTEQMEFDEAYQGMRANERAEDRMRQRMEQQLRSERVSQGRMDAARSRAEINRAASTRAMLRESHARQYGEQSAMQKYGPRPRTLGDELKAGLPSPGMAQPVY